jgi:hypothetical protein
LGEKEETHKETLERLGAERVRIMLTTGMLLPHLVREATEWLAQLDAEDRSRNEASQASQMDAALSTKKAAWIAAIAAIIAAGIAILSWAFPHH